MNTLPASRRRGAARHWVIGCLVVIGLIVLVIAGGGYYAYKKVRENLDIGPFDVVAKVDPPVDATSDQVLPLKAGDFTRTAVTSNTAEIMLMSSTVPTNQRVTVTSGTVAAIYTDPANLNALVLAMNSEEARKNGQNTTNPFSKSTVQTTSTPNKGFHVQSKFKTAEVGIAGWTKPNWTYVVMTTNTAALDFANKFQPAK